MNTRTPTVAQIRGAWDALADDYDEHVYPYTRQLAEAVLNDLDIEPGMKVLDMAAGTGAFSVLAARAGAEVTAVDHAPRMIERLRARARAEGLTKLEGRVMDGHALDLPDDGFDAAVSVQGVSVFPDVERGLAELVRVTKPGGRVCVVAFGPMGKAEPFGFLAGAMKAAVPGFVPPPKDPPPLPFQVADLEVLRRKLADAGLSAVEAESAAWDMSFENAAQFWSTFMSANPAWAQLTADLTDRQRTEVLQVLDGMFREHSGGAPKTVIHTEVNFGTGIK